MTNKGIALGAVGVLFIATGGYVGATSFVGNTTEERFNELLRQWDEHPEVEVTDISYEKGLFESKASAILALESYPEANAVLDLTLSHGMTSNNITGTITPNSDLISGVIDVNMVASSDVLEGSLTADKLNATDADAELNLLTVDIEVDDRWSVDGQAEELRFADKGDVLVVIQPNLGMEAEVGKSMAATYYARIPELTLEGRSGSAHVRDFEVGGDGVDRGELVDQSAFIKVGDVAIDGTSLLTGEVNLEMGGWHQAAVEALQESMTEYQLGMDNPERLSADEHDVLQRKWMEQGVASIYTILGESPTAKIMPMKANINVPMLGVNFEPMLELDVRFNGDELPKNVVYRSLWDEQHGKPTNIEGYDALNQEEAALDLLGRVSGSLTLTTPPPALLSMMPPEVRYMVDPDKAEQNVQLDEGELSINGNVIPLL